MIGVGVDDAISIQNEQLQQAPRHDKVRITRSTGYRCRPMNEIRCAWCGTDPEYVAYHDREWGVPNRDPRALFEALSLELLQTGLAWLTVLRKREQLRAALLNFDPARLATCGPTDVERWLLDRGIIRHRKKLLAIIANARACERLPTDFGTWIWDRAATQPRTPPRHTLSDVPAFSSAALALTADLKTAGFTWIGPTTVYAFMQGVGIVNDHLVTCFRHPACDELGA